MQKVLHQKQLEFLELSAKLEKLFSLDNIYLNEVIAQAVDKYLVNKLK